MKQRLIAIALLILLVAPSAITYVLIEGHRASVRRSIKWDMAEKLDESELVRFEFTAEELENDLVWKHAREFSYRGMMYDIVRRTEENGTHIFVCWPDDEETRLNQLLADVTSSALSNDPVHQTRGQLLAKFLKSFFHPQGESDQKPEETCRVFRESAPSIYMAPFLSTLTPPPDLA